MKQSNEVNGSVYALQYHNKVTCFMLQHIEETCTLGAHAAVIVPPTWIIRVRRQQVQTQPTPQGLTVLPVTFITCNIWLCVENFFKDFSL